jgi:hypothetical protein
MTRRVASDAFATAEFFAQPLSDGTSALELRGVLSIHIAVRITDDAAVRCMGKADATSMGEQRQERGE